MDSASRRATYEDLLAVDDRLVAEIVDGELYTTPRPATPHARAASVLGAQLVGAFDGESAGPERPGGWWILDEPELHLQADIVVPDLAGWRQVRLPRIENVPHLEVAPDWICEVISPRTGILDRRRKMPVYARSGVEWLWLVDPVLRTLEVYLLRNGEWVVASTHGGDEQVGAEPFAAVPLDLRRWWLP